MFTQIFTIPVDLLLLMSKFPSGIIFPSVLRTLFSKFQIWSSGNEYSQFSFIRICPYVTLILKKYFCWLWTVLFFKHFKKFCLFLLTSMVSDENYLITVLPEVICHFSLVAFKIFFFPVFSFFPQGSVEFLKFLPPAIESSSGFFPLTAVFISNNALSFLYILFLCKDFWLFHLSEQHPQQLTGTFVKQFQ